MIFNLLLVTAIGSRLLNQAPNKRQGFEDYLLYNSAQNAQAADLTSNPYLVNEMLDSDMGRAYLFSQNNENISPYMMAGEGDFEDFLIAQQFMKQTPRASPKGYVENMMKAQAMSGLASGQLNPMMAGYLDGDLQDIAMAQSFAQGGSNLNPYLANEIFDNDMAAYMYAQQGQGQQGASNVNPMMFMDNDFSDYLAYQSLTNTQPRAARKGYGDFLEMQAMQGMANGKVDPMMAYGLDGDMKDVLLAQQLSQGGQGMNPYLASEVLDNDYAAFAYAQQQQQGGAQGVNPMLFMDGDAGDYYAYQALTNNQPRAARKGFGDYLEMQALQGRTNGQGQPMNPYLASEVFDNDYAAFAYSQQQTGSQGASGVNPLFFMDGDLGDYYAYQAFANNQPRAARKGFGDYLEMQAMQGLATNGADQTMNPYLASELLDNDYAAYAFAQQQGGAAQGASGVNPLLFMDGDLGDYYAYQAFSNNQPRAARKGFGDYLEMQAMQGLATNGAGAGQMNPYLASEVFDNDYAAFAYAQQQGGAQGASGMNPLLFMDGDLGDYYAYQAFANNQPRAAREGFGDFLEMQALQGLTNNGQKIDPMVAASLGGDYEDLLMAQSLGNGQYNPYLAKKMLDSDLARYVYAQQSAGQGASNMNPMMFMDGDMSDYLMYQALKNQPANTPRGHRGLDDNIQTYAMMQALSGKNGLPANQSPLNYMLLDNMDDEAAMMYAASQNGNGNMNPLLFATDNDDYLKYAALANMNQKRAQAMSQNHPMMPPMMPPMNPLMNNPAFMQYAMMDPECHEADMSDCFVNFQMHQMMFGGRPPMGPQQGPMGPQQAQGNPNLQNPVVQQYMMMNSNCHDADMTDCFADLNMYAMMNQMSRTPTGRRMMQETLGLEGLAGIEGFVDGDILKYEAYKNLVDNGKVEPAMVTALYDGDYVKYAAAQQLTAEGVNPLVAKEMLDSKLVQLEALKKMEEQPDFNPVVADKALDGNYLELKVMQHFMEQGFNFKIAKELADNDYMQYKQLESTEVAGQPNYFVVNEVLDGDYLEYKAIMKLVNTGMDVKSADKMVDKNENLEMAALNDLITAGIVDQTLLAEVLEKDYLKYVALSKLVSSGVSGSVANDVASTQADVSQASATENSQTFQDIAAEIVNNAQTATDAEHPRGQSMSAPATLATGSMTGQNMFGPQMMGWMMMNGFDSPDFPDFPDHMEDIMGLNMMSQGNPMGAMMMDNGDFQDFAMAQMAFGGMNQMMMNQQQQQPQASTGTRGSVIEQYAKQQAFAGAASGSGLNPLLLDNGDILEDLQELQMLKSFAKGNAGAAGSPVTANQMMMAGMSGGDTLSDMLEDKMKAQQQAAMYSSMTGETVDPMAFMGNGDAMEDMMKMKQQQALINALTAEKATTQTRGAYMPMYGGDAEDYLVFQAMQKASNASSGFNAYLFSKFSDEVPMWGMGGQMNTPWMFMSDCSEYHAWETAKKTDPSIKPWMFGVDLEDIFKCQGFAGRTQFHFPGMGAGASAVPMNPYFMGDHDCIKYQMFQNAKATNPNAQPWQYGIDGEEMLECGRLFPTGGAGAAGFPGMMYDTDCMAYHAWTQAKKTNPMANPNMYGVEPEDFHKCLVLSVHARGSTNFGTDCMEYQMWQNAKKTDANAQPWMYGVDSEDMYKCEAGFAFDNDCAKFVAYNKAKQANPSLSPYAFDIESEDMYKCQGYINAQQNVPTRASPKPWDEDCLRYQQYAKAKEADASANPWMYGLDGDELYKCQGVVNGQFPFLYDSDCGKFAAYQQAKQKDPSVYPLAFDLDGEDFYKCQAFVNAASKPAIRGSYKPYSSDCAKYQMFQNAKKSDASVQPWMYGVEGEDMYECQGFADGRAPFVYDSDCAKFMAWTNAKKTDPNAHPMMFDVEGEDLYKCQAFAKASPRASYNPFDNDCAAYAAWNQAKQSDSNANPWAFGVDSEDMYKCQGTVNGQMPFMFDEDCAKFVAFSNAQENDPTVSPYMFDVDVEDTYKCQGFLNAQTAGSMPLMVDYDSDCAKYLAYTQSQSAGASTVSPYMFDLDAKDVAKCQAFASAAAHHRGRVAQFDPEGECMKYAAFLKAQETNPDVNMWQYGLDPEDQFKCQAMGITAEHANQFHYMKEECLKYAAYASAHEKNPLVTMYQYDVEPEDSWKCGGAANVAGTASMTTGFLKEDCMKYAAYQKAKETNPAAAPWQFDLEAEDQWKCSGTSGALFPMEMETDCFKYQAYAQAKETNPSLALWQYDLDPKDEWKCKAFASSTQKRGASPYFGYDSECWKYKMWQDAKEKNPNANMWMYGVDWEDQFKCQYMTSAGTGGVSQGPVSSASMMKEDCAKVAAYLRAKQTNPNAQPWQFDIEAEAIAECQAIGTRGKRQFGVDEAMKYQQLSEMEKTGMLSDEMFDEDYLQWKAMQGAGASNAMMFDEDAWKYGVGAGAGVNPMMFDEDAWKYGVGAGSAGANPMMYDEDAWKYQQLADMQAQGYTSEEMFDEDFLRYNQWKNSQARGPILKSPRSQFVGEDAYKYEQLWKMKNQQGAQFGPELAKKLLDEDFLRYEAWKNSQTNVQAPTNPMMFDEEYWKYTTPTGGVNTGAALFGEDVLKYEQLLNMKSQQQPGFYNSELAEKLLDEDFLRYEQWKKSQTTPRAQKEYLKTFQPGYVDEEILKFQQLQNMENQGMMNDNMFDEDYLRWKHTQQNGGAAAAASPMLDEDAWKYSHPGYGIFGDEAWQYDELLKMKEAGQLTDKMLDEDFLKYEQWKHAQEKPAAAKPTVPSFGGQQAGSFPAFGGQQAGAFPAFGGQPVFNPVRPTFGGMGVQGQAGFGMPQGMFDVEFMNKLATWKALHGGRAATKYNYSPYNMYSEYTPYQPYYQYPTWTPQYYQPQTPVVNPAYSMPKMPSMPYMPSMPAMSKSQMTEGLNKVLNNQIDVFAEDKKCANANVNIQVDVAAMRNSMRVDSRCSSYYTVSQKGDISCVPAGDSCDLVEEAGSVIFYIPGATLAELDQAVEEAEKLDPKRNGNFSPLTGETVEA